MRRIKFANANKYFTVDDEDYAKVSPFRWFLCAPEGKKKCPRGNMNNTSVTLSRFLLNAPKGLLVDHKNRNPFDNRRKNLRLCTYNQNAGNRIMRGNKSGFKGVFTHVKIGYFVTCNKKYYGWFRDKIEAAKAYNEAAKKEFGEFALLNKIPRYASNKGRR